MPGLISGHTFQELHRIRTGKIFDMAFFVQKYLSEPEGQYCDYCNITILIEMSFKY